MAEAALAQPFVTPEEYDRMSFTEVTPDLVDGRLVERSLPYESHSEAVTTVSDLFLDLGRQTSTPFIRRTELTVRTEPRRRRVIDLAIFLEKPTEERPTTPPLVALEVLSPDDNHLDLVKKLAEYYSWGVRHVWMADPWSRKLHVYDERGLHEVGAFELPEYGRSFTLAEVFPASRKG